MTGTLYGIGVGPGDPELLTLKAVRVLRSVPVVAVPVTQRDAESYALTVVSDLVGSEKRVFRLLFPMLKDVEARRQYRQAATAEIVGELQAGRDVAFLTEGDCLLHSTFVYVLEGLPDGLPVEIIPGVTSVSASAAYARQPLVTGDQRLAIVPGGPTILDDLPGILRSFDTVVLLKFNRVFDELLDLIEKLQLCDRTILVERAMHHSGRVIRDIGSLRGQPVHYFSLLIIKGGREGAER